jgi:hypothetical protein
MKIAYATSTIVQNGPNKGKLKQQMTADVVPNLERKQPPTPDVVEDYSKNLLKAEDCTVRLVSSTIRAEHIKAMRVRMGKAGPNGKKRTDLDLLARGTEVYKNGARHHIERNEGFNKFGNVQIEAVQKGQTVCWCTDPNIHYLVITEPDAKGYADLQCRDNLALSGSFYVQDPDIRVIDKAASKREKIWVHNERLKPLKMLSKVVSIADGSNNMLETTNRLLRQILLFKAIDFERIAQDLEKAGGKPVTYAVNTLIELNTGESDTEGRPLMRRLKVHKCTVKKVFRDADGGGTGVFFSGTCCQPITLWLKSLNLYF